MKIISNASNTGKRKEEKKKFNVTIKIPLAQGYSRDRKSNWRIVTGENIGSGRAPRRLEIHDERGNSRKTVQTVKFQPSSPSFSKNRNVGPWWSVLEKFPPPSNRTVREDGVRMLRECVAKFGCTAAGKPRR